MTNTSIISNIRYSGDKSLQDLLLHLPEHFASGKGELIYDGRNKLRRFILPSGLTVIVKSYKRPNIFQRICYSSFWKNKAIKSYIFGNKLLEYDIDTPGPIAAVTYKNFIGCISEYFFVSTENKDPNCLVLRDGHIKNTDADALIDALATYLAKLHKIGFLHGDTNLSNFLYHKQEDNSYHFAVIDTNRSRFLNRPATRQEALKNLSRLTHKRELLSSLVKSYARKRDWDENLVEKEVTAMLVSRERKKELKHKFTRFLKATTAIMLSGMLP